MNSKEVLSHLARYLETRLAPAGLTFTLIIWAPGRPHDRDSVSVITPLRSQPELNKVLETVRGTTGEMKP